ncbi:MAG: BlaI/MecI/CopY family transcriptional regulator [Lachnospiraceae bacterium]|nr:BlaI/MecI/CopY family transcriptional regulator [Lachnospiraceae bacterium]
MPEYRLGEIELKFAEIIWSHEPLLSGELVKLCEEALTWKKSTTYTILRRLCERGMFQNENGTVTSLISREQFFSLQSEQFVEETFEGSLPQFLTAFTRRKKLSEQEITELKKIIEENREQSK